MTNTARTGRKRPAKRAQSEGPFELSVFRGESFIQGSRGAIEADSPSEEEVQGLPTQVVGETERDARAWVR